MANKRITELQLRDEVTDDLNVPSDDGIQSYRVTALQFYNYILAKISNVLTPTGAIFAYTSTTAPSGFLLCDGSAVNRTTYASLFAVIGTTHGQGDGSTTFNLPDYRGRFLRGADDYGVGASSRDTHTRSAMNTGGNSSGVGSVQNDALQGHKHSVTDPGHVHSIALQNLANEGGTSNGYRAGNAPGDTSVGGGISNTTGLTVQTPTTDGTNGTPRTASETVPKNAAVVYIIKA